MHLKTVNPQSDRVIPSISCTTQRYLKKIMLKKEKAAFLKEFNLKYGYRGKIDIIREEEYPQLKGKRNCYLFQFIILILTFNIVRLHLS
jgi:hypothetical protein